MSLEIKAARATAGSMQGISWGAITRGLGSAAGWLSGVLGGGQQPAQPVTRTPGLSGVVQRILPGGATGYETRTPAAAAAPMIAEPGMTIACPSGYRPNKSGYYVADGNGGGIWVAPGTKCVKKRRRNSLNPRAASRAMSRIEGAKKASRSLDRFSIKCKKCGKMNCREH